MRAMSITIKDVAKRANVAPSTVSRVISDSPKISEKTKRKVRAIMEEMGYHLNLNARFLVKQSTQTIGIVMKNSTQQSLHNPFFPEVLSGISTLCQKHNYSITLTTGESEESIFEDVVKMVQGKRVDGLVVLYSKKDDKVIPYLLECGFPFVLIGKPLISPNHVMYVDNDNVQSTKEVTEFLINLGHKNIAFIGGDPHFEVLEARLNGFKAALMSNSIEVPEEYFKYFNFDPVVGNVAISELMNLPTPPTALVITDDLNALIVMMALREMNISVPEEVSVVSFNNTIISRLSSPPLTSVDTQSLQLGYEAAKCLIELLEEPTMVKKSVIIPTVIIKRESQVPVTTRILSK